MFLKKVAGFYKVETMVRGKMKPPLSEFLYFPVLLRKGGVHL